MIVDKGGNAREKRLPVAVKVLKSSRGGGHAEAEKQFKAEVSTLGKIHHVNLVDLVGYSSEEAELPGRECWSMNTSRMDR